ncbi:MAG: 3-isopropylmalate dehydratase small subunit [Lentisphaerae bacterium]|nr:3-isopropylmalate dehydratase small subunit [Lentisphaerota bacterium]
MEPFVKHTGLVAVLDRANVDTDQIIPKQFLKSIRRTGFGPALFFDWRYLADASPDPAFELNAPRFAGASVLVTRNNFGCGSSREHAVWAVRQYGFRVVIAPWQMRGETRVPAFADIFRNNSVKNGLLTVELAEAEIDAIVVAVAATPGLRATVDLERQTVSLAGPSPMELRFEIDPTVRETLLGGLDEVQQTLQFEADIRRFEAGHDAQLPAAAVG